MSFSKCEHGSHSLVPRNTDLPDGELSIDKMIERDAASDDVASRLRCIDVDLILSFQRLDRFGLDQSHFAARARSLAVAAGLAKVTIPFQPFAGDGLNFCNEDDRSTSGRRDMDGNNGASHTRVHFVTLLATNAFISGVCIPSFSRLHVPLSRISCASRFVAVIAALVKPDP